MGAEVATTVAALVGGIVIGATLHWMATGTPNPYGKWLGRECWVRPISRPRWRKHVVVAVSWRGAICVREADRIGQEGYWIKKQNVKRRVLWCEPEGKDAKEGS